MSAPERQPRGAFEALDHVIVAVEDLGRARREAAVLLGRAPSFEGEHPALGTRNALFRTGNHYLELLAPAGPGPGARLVQRHLAERGPGLAGLALRTPSLDACVARLRAAGVAVGEPSPGLGRDEQSGAFRRWRSVALPAGEARGLFLLAIEHLSPPELLPEAPPREAPRASVSGLDHVVVRSGHLEASRAFFGARLGIRLALDRSFPELGLRMLFFRLGGVTLEVVGRLGAAPEGGGDALFGLAWRVPDVDAARARLAAAGLEVDPVRPGRKPGTRVTTVRSGTCGVPTLLIGPERPPASG